LANGADINAKDRKGGGTALHYAVGNGHKDAVELLLSKKAEVNVTDDTGATPLSWAAGAGHKDMAKLLLAGKADVNSRDNSGWTPLDIASHEAHKDLVELLRKHGGLR
jgi:uncharacterized protein